MRCEATRAVLLLRHGLLFLDDQAEGAERRDSYAEAIGANLATIGYVPSTQLSARLSRLTAPALDEVQRWTFTTLSAALGGGQVHEPLFRKFPYDIPSDTRALWWQKVLVHFLGKDGQPCLFCHRIGTTHVLSPCRHVVCERCFDGANYSACPVCEQKVDRRSPFFKPSASRLPANEEVRFKLLDIGDDLDAAVRTLLVSFCARTQAMSPDDVRALVAIVTDYGARILPWLPETIPVRENVAHVFGTLFRSLDPGAVLPIATPYLKTATDVLRTIAAYSGADPSLQATERFTPMTAEEARRWTFPKPDPKRPVLPPGMVTAFSIKSPRFAVGKVKRPTRRALFALLESMPADALVEDMLRHRSTWIGVGELLHPHEYAKRFPNVARAFQIVRGKDPNGTPAPAFKTYYGQLAARTEAYDLPAVLALLSARPGELARRLDHLLRLASDDAGLTEAVLAALGANVARFATPVLVALRSHFGARHAPAAVRVYWPKGAVTKGVSGPDTRDPLRADVIGDARRVIDDELLRRFSALSAFDTAVLDDALRDIPVPFNERTASRSAVSLPRGSRVAVPDGKLARLFLHWCEPENGGHRTDIDLSVAFYDETWSHVGTCSYYQLRCGTFATSAGDLTSAPFPDGSTEFIDIDLARAKWAGVRHAVMVVNSFSGMTFSTLERGFAGLMLRDDPGGAHFDPRTATSRFDLQGENGIFMPLSFDLESRTLHWLDVYSKGQLSMNNVATSNSAIQTIVPT